jgi:hypothetical protein
MTPGPDQTGTGGSATVLEGGLVALTTLDDASSNEQAPAEIEPRLLGIQIEAKLRDWNIPYEYVEEFPLAKVRNAEWAQVREAAHIADKDTVSEYRTQMGQGAVYPPIVIMSPDVLVDGNTRVSAAKGLRRKTFPAFVVQFNSVDLAKSFGAAMNQLGGRRLTTDEAYQAAVTMMARGMADEAVAREVGRSVEHVRQMRRRKEYAERSKALPEIATVAASIPQKAQIKLAQISHDPAFTEAVKVVTETRPSAKVVSDIVKAATDARTDTDAIEAVRAIRAELAPAGPPPVRVTVPTEVKQSAMHLGGLLKFAGNPLVLLDTSTPERREGSVKQWQQLHEMAGEVLRLYGIER